MTKTITLQMVDAVVVDSFFEKGGTLNDKQAVELLLKNNPGAKLSRGVVTKLKELGYETSQH